MNKQTETALKMVTDILDDELWFPNKYPDEAIPVCFIEALKACKEALEPDRTGMVYYKNNACKAKDANSPDCICWTPEQSAQEALTRAQQVIRANNSAQEPVAWMHRHEGEITEFNDFQSCDKCEPLYTHPAPSWQGLSDEKIHEIYEREYDNYHVSGIGRGCITDNEWEIWIARAIEQALKEKNTWVIWLKYSTNTKHIKKNEKLD